MAILSGAFVDSEHFRLSMYASICYGVWPMAYEHDPIKHKLYRSYSLVFYLYLWMFLCTAIIRLGFLFADDVKDFDEIMRNVSVSLVHVVGLCRSWRLWSVVTKDIMKTFMKLEKRYKASEDDEIIDIYKKTVARNVFYCKLYLVNGYFLATLICVTPIFVPATEKVVGNETLLIKMLPLSAWTPVDPQVHYVGVYIYEVVSCSIGAKFMVDTDLITLGIIIFLFGELKVLAHVLRKLPKYIQKVQEQLNLEEHDEATFIALRECVLIHKRILRNIYEFNNSMKFVMLLDFIQCSFHLSIVILQLLVLEKTIANLIVPIWYVLCICIRLYAYYFNANELIIMGNDVRTALYESPWYIENRKIKQILQMMMLRCQEPLALSIGPFGTMTLETFLGIWKASYSYITLFYNGE